MRILFTNASLTWGGNEKWTLNAAETLAARCHDVSIAIRDPKLWQPHKTSEKVRWIVLPFTNDADVITIWKLHRILKREKIEIFLPTRSRDYWLAGFARLGTDAKYVMRMGITRSLPDTIKERLRYGTWPDAIIVNAQAVKDSLVKHPWVIPDHIHVIYNGVDSETLAFPHEARGNQKGVSGVDSDLVGAQHVVPAQKNDDTIRVLAAGRIETEKGFDVLVDAMALALQHEPRLRCEIWGKGDQREVLIEKVRALGLEDKITLPGFTPGIAPKLQTADIAVSSSYREGISNFILESWAAGVPLIATAIEGSAEIVHHGERGLLVPPGASQKMSEAILEMAHDKDLRERCISGGKDAIRTTHNWTTMAEKMEELFENLRPET